MKWRFFLGLFFSLVLIISSVLAMKSAYVYEFSLILEKKQNWKTYQVGGTCISGGHNLFLEDVDADGLTEIIAGGSAYKLVDEERLRPLTPLTIWNWDGKNLDLGKHYQWQTNNSTSISCVYAADADGDGKIEILTGGRFSNGSITFAQLGVYRWDGVNLIMESSKEFAESKEARVNSIFVNDLDKDGLPEIITSGRTYCDIGSRALLQIWHLSNDGLMLQQSVEWCALNEASASSVCAGDVNNDGISEILTCGFDNNLLNSSGQLRLWKWDKSTLSLEESHEWQMIEGYVLDISGNIMGNTISNALDVGDVDGDGKIEVITAGFTYDGTGTLAQVRIWSWTGDTLTLKCSHEWSVQSINEVKSMSIEDVDSDGKQEIVTSGFIGNPTEWPKPSHSLAQLKVWSWDKEKLTLKTGRDWTAEDAVCAWNVGTGDVDNDGITEIITVGCMHVATFCDPDMRIWSISKEPTPILYALQAVTTVGAVIAIVSVFMLVKKNQRKTNYPSSNHLER